MSRETSGEGRIVKLLRLGTDQVVDIPEDLELPPGDAYVWRDGDLLVISPFPPREPLPSDTGDAETR